MTENIEERECPSCGGQGQIGDYVGLEMRCVGAECDRCKGTGRLPSSVEPKAQVESASVEPKPICECGHEESQHWPESKDKYKLRRCSDLGCDCELYEPKEVESGEGLPPLSYDWKGIESILEERESQLKASLLREKGLRQLLREVLSEIQDCGSDYHHPENTDLTKRLKAAFTGE